MRAMLFGLVGSALLLLMSLPLLSLRSKQPVGPHIYEAPDERDTPFSARDVDSELPSDRLVGTDSSWDGYQALNEEAAVADRSRPQTIDPQVARIAQDLFLQLDQNGDGLLSDEEMTNALRTERNRWDANQDGVIDLEEFRHYFAARVAQFRAEETPVQTPPSRRIARVPARFEEMATDPFGAMVLSEWKATGGTREDLRRLDRNGDGFLTPEEPASSPSREKRLKGISSVRRGEEEGASTNSTAINRGTTAGPTPSNTAMSGLSAVLLPKKPATPKTAERVEAQHVATAAARAPAPVKARVAAKAPPAPPALPTASPALDAQATMAMTLEGGAAFLAAADARNVQALLDGGHANVLFLGDSITDGLTRGPGTPVWDSYFAPLDAINLGIPGLTTSQVLWQVETGQVAYASPDVVVLMIGTNNLSIGQSPEAVAAGITKIVSELRTQMPRSRVLLLGILPRGPNPGTLIRARLAQVNRLISALDDGDHVRFLDIGGGFLLPDGTLPALLMPDYLHPSLSGYQVETAEIWATLMQMLAEY